MSTVGSQGNSAQQRDPDGLPRIDSTGQADGQPPRGRPQEPLFRIWIAGYQDWFPTRWNEVPPTAVALQPAEEGCLVAEKARAFLKGFNRQMLAQAKPLWAVALPVCVQFAGDAHCGQSVHGHQFPLEPAPSEAG